MVTVVSEGAASVRSLRTVEAMGEETAEEMAEAKVPRS